MHPVSSVPMVGTVGNKSWASALRHRYKRASSEALFFYCYPALFAAGGIVQNMGKSATRANLTLQRLTKWLSRDPSASLQVFP